MQKGRNFLHEIIWEITGRCENGCDYCGSKDIRNTAIDEEKILNIAKEIAKYPPKIVDVSGGDPLLIAKETHKKIVKIFKDKDIESHILINPKSIAYRSSYTDICKLYNVTGISINTGVELKLANDIALIDLDREKVTVITNFNIHNIFMFDDILETVLKYKLCWQIQYTMYYENTDALYNNQKAVAHLREKIKQALKKGAKIVLADNMNEGFCGAGTMSCGITHEGFVVPCLSMRSWDDPKNFNSYQLNILGDGLGEIWEGTYFKQFRFGEFKCCKDVCNSPLNINEIIKEISEEDRNKPNSIIKWIEQPCDYPPTVALYGVTVYSVTTPNVVAYAVSPPGTAGTFIYGTVSPNAPYVITTTDSTSILTYDSVKKDKKDE